MPPQKERLTKSHLVSLTKGGQKKTVRGVLFDTVYAPAETARVACVISTKRVKRAVDRNRIRRKMYHAWMMVTPHKPYHVILYPQAHVLRVAQQTLQDELTHTLTTLH